MKNYGIFSPHLFISSFFIAASGGTQGFPCTSLSEYDTLVSVFRMVFVGENDGEKKKFSSTDGDTRFRCQALARRRSDARQVARHAVSAGADEAAVSAACLRCAFTNAGGGFIVIGVDNDGNPSKRQLRIEGLRDYENIISATEPSVAATRDRRPATRMAERRRNDMRVSKGRNAGASVAERMSLVMPCGAATRNLTERKT